MRAEWRVKDIALTKHLDLVRIGLIGPRGHEWVVGAIGAKGLKSPDEAIKACIEVGSKHGVHLIALNPDAVAGFTHIAFAAEHAVRAWDEGRRAARYLELELQLYLVGTREIREAVAVCRPRGEEVVLVVLGKSREKAVRALEELMTRLGLSRDDKLLELTPKRALRVAETLGIPTDVLEAANKGDLISAVVALASNRAVLLSLS